MPDRVEWQQYFLFYQAGLATKPHPGGWVMLGITLALKHPEWAMAVAQEVKAGEYVPPEEHGRQIEFWGDGWRTHDHIVEDLPVERRDA